MAYSDSFKKLASSSSEQFKDLIEEDVADLSYNKESFDGPLDKQLYNIDRFLFDAMEILQPGPGYLTSEVDYPNIPDTKYSDKKITKFSTKGEILEVKPLVKEEPKVEATPAARPALAGPSVEPAATRAESIPEKAVSSSAKSAKRTPLRKKRPLKATPKKEITLKAPTSKKVTITKIVKPEAKKSTTRPVEVTKPSEIYSLSDFLTEVSLVSPKVRINKKTVEQKLFLIIETLNVTFKLPERKFFSDGKDANYEGNFPFSERGKLTYIFLLYLYFKYKDIYDRRDKRKRVVFEYLELHESDKFWLNYKRSIESIFPTEGQQEDFGGEIFRLLGKQEDYSIENIFVGSESAYIGFYLHYLKSKFYVSGTTTYFTRGTIVIPNTTIMIKKVSYLTTMSDKPVEFPIQLFCDIDGSKCVVLNGTYSPISDADRENRFITDRLGHNLITRNGQFIEVNGEYFDIEAEDNVDYVLDYEVLKSVYFPSKSITYISEANGGNDISFVVRNEGIKVDEETVSATSSRSYSYIGLLNQYRLIARGKDFIATNLENYKFLKKYLFLLKDSFPAEGTSLKEEAASWLDTSTDGVFRFKLEEGDLKIVRDTGRYPYNTAANRFFQIEYAMYIAAKKLNFIELQKSLEKEEISSVLDLSLFKTLDGNFIKMSEEKIFFKASLNNNGVLDESKAVEFFYYYNKKTIKENIVNEIFIENGNILNIFLSIEKVEFEYINIQKSGKIETVKNFYLSFEKDGIAYVLLLSGSEGFESPVENIEGENSFEAYILRAEHLIKYSVADNTFYMDSDNKIDFSFKDDGINVLHFKAADNKVLALNRSVGFPESSLYYKIPSDLKIEYTPERKPNKKRANGDTYYKVEEVK
jgi:hypothetical protein